MLAAAQGNFKVVKSLIVADANMDARDTRGRTALHHAARGGFDDCVDVLMSQKADTNAVTNSGLTPLCFAAMYGRYHAVCSLLYNKVDVNISDRQGRSALWLAAENGHPICVELLLRSGAAIKQMDTHDKTPLQRVKQRIRVEKNTAPRVDISEYKETAKILRKYQKLLNTERNLLECCIL